MSTVKDHSQIIIRTINSQNNQSVFMLGPMDNYIVNKPEAKKLFEFLNPFLKLPDRRVLGGDILDKIVAELNDAMETSLIQRQLRISNRSAVFYRVAHQLNLCVDEILKSLLNINYYLNIEPPVIESRRQTGEELPLPHEIFEIINSPTFWSQITIISQNTYPYCKLLNVIQCGIFQVVHSMGYLAQY
ncbi:hypothetical protein RclHR1_33570002 [Rhizophagus clarus]|uniref:Uncharacterized protein n=1 Tax=Rhizophagus clarus TaxID=94130 RepID=A0A2Z6RP45_9GLOM|nr:hypothetical protein RclHR1_33570002 [Rhizophagus clarus]